MNKRTQSFIILLLFSPMFAFAHGEEVLITIGVEFLSLLTLFILLWNMQLKLITKLTFIVINFIGYYFVYLFTKNLPYRDNLLLISFLHTIVPLIVIAAAYLSVRRRFRKTNSD